MKRLFILTILLLPVLSACAATRPSPTANPPTRAPAPIETQSPGFACADVAEIPIDECLSLVALYLHMGGPNWNTNYEEWVGKDLWLETKTPCSWGGVTCAEGHVSEITLVRVSTLPGELPAEIASLSRLTKLDLSGNHL
ncbi:MAG TPA: hypothetical protein DCG54_04080, partial [Anaerolineae bacterium]|nr:hypothetical protein [Anaerolineae bacterium]